MNTALTQNGKIIAATAYAKESHGNRLYCIDQGCKAPVIFIPGSETVIPHFKTTGKNGSIHKNGCGFARSLSFEEALGKAEEYHSNLLEQGIKENIIKINLMRLDPDIDIEKRDSKRDNDKNQNPNEIKVKQDNAPPKTISSLKTIVKLIKDYEPDMLASVLVNIKGTKIPLSQLIVSHDKAHTLLWNDLAVSNFNYFVYGTIERVFRRDKVIYINLKPVNDIPFSLVVFERYFKHFTYIDEQLVNKKILAAGVLRKNTFNDKNTTEMVIKSNDFIQFL